MGLCTDNICVEGDINAACSEDSDCDITIPGLCSPGVCMESGANDGKRCSTDSDCGCVGNFAPGIYWPHKVAKYKPQWPAPLAPDGEVVGEIVIASRVGGRLGGCACTGGRTCSRGTIGAICTADTDCDTTPGAEDGACDPGTCTGGGTNDGNSCYLYSECGCTVEYTQDAEIYSVGGFSMKDEDKTDLVGWNPNDEHAIILPIDSAYRVFAVRDDDPWQVSSGHPYTIVKRPYGTDTSLYELDVYHVVAESGAEDLFFDYADADRTIPVLAGQPIDPLFPVNFASPLCDDDTGSMLTFVYGDALWQDNKGGIWSVEQHEDTYRCVADLCDAGPLVGQACTTHEECNVYHTCIASVCDGGPKIGESCSDDYDCNTSGSDIYLWENWAPDYGCQPWRAFARFAPPVPVGANGMCFEDTLGLCMTDDDCGSGTCYYPYPITYSAQWPPLPPECVFPTDPNCARPLQMGETVDQSGQCGQIMVLHDSVGLQILDPTREVRVDFTDLQELPDFGALPPHLHSGEIAGGGEWPDRIWYDYAEFDLVFRGVMSPRDRETLKSIDDSDGTIWDGAIDVLYIASREQLDPATQGELNNKFVSVGRADAKPGWITLAFQNDQECVDEGLPVSVDVWRVDCPPDPASIRVIQPRCFFSEKQVLQFAGDLGGRPENMVFQWQWSGNRDCLEDPDGCNDWNDYNPPDGPAGCTDGVDCYRNGVGLREVIIEGASQFTLADSYWRVRYRGYSGCPCEGGDCNECDDTWPDHLVDDGTKLSDWTDTQLAEGWVKRVLRGLNPFDQRLESFHENAANTFVHMIGQAGKRYLQNIALNCDPANINDIGLIEAYETVLNRAKAFSIDAPTPVVYGPANKAIMLASGKVLDLYMLLGNEAYADALDPTIGLFYDQGDPPGGYDPHAVFCFEEQVGSLLEEELALLRGRDETRPPDENADGQTIATVDNRLPWNFTSGYGQVAYTNNYQVTELEEARGLYPQGHGDAWGHYLTATKKIYDLLTHDRFTWLAFTEDVLVGGQPVEVGFKYERKFAEAAAAKARTGAAIVSQTFRQMYSASPSQQHGYPDVHAERAWGVGEWAKRAGQAALFDWVTANTLLEDDIARMRCSDDGSPCTSDDDCVAGTCGPAEARLMCSKTDDVVYCLSTDDCIGVHQDSDGNDDSTCSVPETDRYVCDISQGPCAPSLGCEVGDGDCVLNDDFTNSIRRIDRTTVPELKEIAAAFGEIQATVDKADAGLNPLGLATNVVPFGINPSEIKEGKTHFDQVFERAVGALNNAVTCFNYANENTRRLRAVQDQVDQFDDLVEERELDYEARLIEIFGRPYDEDLGIGGTYAADYYGPDIYHFAYVDPSDLLPMSNASNTTTFWAIFDEPQFDPITGAYLYSTREVEFNVSTDGLGLIKPEDWLERPEPGEIQFARGELLQSIGRYLQALDRYEAHLDQIEAQTVLLESLYQLNADVLQVMREGQAEQKSLNEEILLARSLQLAFRTMSRAVILIGRASAECLPTNLVAGLASGGDFTAPIRCSAEFSAQMFSQMLDSSADIVGLVELQRQHDKEWASAEQQIQITNYQGNYQVKQQVEALRQLVRQTPSLRLEIYMIEEAIKQATGRYQAAVGRGLRLLEQRTAFRQRTAGEISEHRYRDMAFRVFRNEALQKYRAQFDLAAQYVYLAARVYDYETNLLGTHALAGRQFLSDIVKERTLGVVDGGTPLVGNGLAGQLGAMWANFDLVLRPQLGFNSPEEINRTFNLRWEGFRIDNTPAEDPLWRDVLSGNEPPPGNSMGAGFTIEVVNSLEDVPEYLQYCVPLDFGGGDPTGCDDPGSDPNANPAIVIRFDTRIESGLNLFGIHSHGDEVFPSTYNAIKLHAVGIRLLNYPSGLLNNQAEMYLIPRGADILRVPSDRSIREWHLLDQTLPVPFPFGEQDLESPDWTPIEDGTIGGSNAVAKRRHYPTITGLPAQGTPDDEDLRYFLTGRSAWNTGWTLIIPGSELYGQCPTEGIEIFIENVRDIRLLFNTYGYAGTTRAAEEDAEGEGQAIEDLKVLDRDRSFLPERFEKP